MQKVELSVSEVRAMYFDDTALLVSPWRIFRYNWKGDRYYYYRMPVQLTEAGVPTPETAEVKLAAGVTTITKRTIPQDEFLTKWIAQQGYEEAIAYRDERSKYGSLWHTIAAELLINRQFDLDTLPEIVAGYALKNTLTIDAEAWVDGLKQDTLALAQFFIDYNVKPLAIELSLVAPHLKVAGTLDLFCEMDKEEKGYFGEVYASGERKGQPKETKRTVRQLAIVDFKSGRNIPSSLHNAAQLKLLRLLLDIMLEKVYDQQPAALEMGMYNLHPKNWRTKPDYTLVDQAGKCSTDFVLRKIADYYEYDVDPEEKTVLKMQGLISLDNEKGAEENYSVENIKQLVQAKVDAGEMRQGTYDSVQNYLHFGVNDTDEA